MLTTKPLEISDLKEGLLFYTPAAKWKFKNFILDNSIFVAEKLYKKENSIKKDFSGITNEFHVTELENCYVDKYLVVYYHGDDCMDGIGAAWAVRGNYSPGSTKYIAIDYNEEPIEEDYIDQDVVVADFSFKYDIMLKVLEKCKSLTIIDHHKTVQEVLTRSVPDSLKSKLEIIFQTNHSGAYLTHVYFHKNENVPLAIRYIEDRDLWKFEMHKSKEINAYLKTIISTIGNLDEIISYGYLDTEEDLESAIDYGELILRYEKKLINKILKNKYMIDFTGYNVPYVNSPVYYSELGNVMSKDYPFAVVGRTIDKDTIKLDLRSGHDGLDVSEIAKQFGGGGHKHAAGCYVKHSSIFEK